MNGIFKKLITRIDKSLPVPTGIQIFSSPNNVDRYGRFSVFVEWSEEYLSYQVRFVNLKTGKWDFKRVDKRYFEVNLVPSRYKLKVRCSSVQRKMTYGEWSPPTEFELSEDGTVAFQTVSIIPRLKFDPTLPVPSDLTIETGRQDPGQLRVTQRWQGEGPYQAALYDVVEGKWQYEITNERSYTISLEPGRYRFKARNVVHDNPPKAGPWSEIITYEIDEEFRLHLKARTSSRSYETVADRIRESWRINIRKNEPPSSLFIGGAARTGTTLLQSILCSDSLTNPLISEAVPIRFLVEAYKKTVSNYHVFPKMYFDDIQEITTFYSNSIETFLIDLKKKYDCEIPVLKEPALTKYFPDILYLIKDVRFLCIIRDPRSTIASMVVWGEKMLKNNKEHFFQQRDMKKLSKYYLDFYLPLFNCQDESFVRNTKYLRYEDLVKHPFNILNEIREFTRLGLQDYDPTGNWISTMLDFDDKSSPMQYAITELYGKPISAVRVDTFREVLSNDEITLIEKECFSVFRYFNYKMSTA